MIKESFMKVTDMFKKGFISVVQYKKVYHGAVLCGQKSDVDQVGNIYFSRFVCNGTHRPTIFVGPTKNIPNLLRFSMSDNVAPTTYCMIVSYLGKGEKLHVCMLRNSVKGMFSRDFVITFMDIS